MQVAEQREAQLLAKAAARQSATQTQHQAILLSVHEESLRQQVGQNPGRFQDALYECGMFHTTRARTSAAMHAYSSHVQGTHQTAVW